MVVDALMQRLFSKRFDLEGKTARRGKVLPGVVEKVMRDGYFSCPAAEELRA